RRDHYRPAERLDRGGGVGFVDRRVQPEWRSRLPRQPVGIMIDGARVRKMALPEFDAGAEIAHFRQKAVVAGQRDVEAAADRLLVAPERGVAEADERAGRIQMIPVEA